MINTTIVIPNLNGMKFLPDCMQAIRKQTKKEYKLVLVDNGSNDGSIEWIEKNCQEAEVIAFAQNKGFCEAVNAGIERANTKYVLLLNNDTVVYPEFLKEMELIMELHANCFSASAQMLQMSDPKRLDGAGDYYSAFGWAYARGKDKLAFQFAQEKKIFASCAGAAIYRREVFEKIGFFDQNHFAYLEDLDIGYRARVHGYENRYAPNAKVEHAGSGFSGSRHNAFKIELSAKNNVYLIYKNMPLLQILLNSPFLITGFIIKGIFFWKKGFGKVYAKGIQRGIKLCFSEKGRSKKVRFEAKNVINYGKIQWELWLNLFRRF